MDGGLGIGLLLSGGLALSPGELDSGRECHGGDGIRAVWMTSHFPCSMALSPLSLDGIADLFRGLGVSSSQILGFI